MADRGKELGTALRELGKAIIAGAPNDQTLLQSIGWNAPPMDRSNLASMANQVAAKLEGVPDSSIRKDFNIQPIIEKIEIFKSQTLPYLWNGNGPVVLPIYTALLSWIDLTFYGCYETKVDWEKVSSDGLLPKAISTKLRSYKSTMARFDVDVEDLQEKIEYINQAHDAANALPTDLESLKAAAEEVSKRRESAESDELKSTAALKEVERLLAEITMSEKEAKKLVENTEDAYSAATTKGLGEAFQQRADRLSRSMWTWVSGLTGALGLGAYLGSLRFEALQKLVAANASSSQVWLDMGLAFISVAAPVWFAWLATKQIGHRFRLSEDYAFKASVARAYEGYRREAARLDPAFAQRLFSSALDRLDEAPIRFVEQETFGSPFHEFFKRKSSSPTSPTRATFESDGKAQIILKPEVSVPPAEGATV